MTALRTALVTLLTAVLLLTGCSAGNNGASVGGSAELGATNDVNPQDPTTLREGGNLRLALSELPPNWNGMHLDGNTVDLHAVNKATLPRAFIIAADGSATVNTDYFTSVEQTGSDPQQITYTINPKAVWSDGTPITWEDIASQVRANSGKDPAYQIAAPNGYDRVDKVTRGVDDRQAVITFAKPYAEWRGMFAGNATLQPRSMTANPEVFNTGQRDKPGPSAGPFVVTGIDRSAQRITLSRNPRWWGATPRLDTITFLVLDDAARIGALQNNEIDATGIANVDELTKVRQTAGLTVRRAPSAAWSTLTFNGAPGAILSDRALRQAIAKGIDRQLIADVLQRGLTDNPTPLNNHIYVAGQEGYQNNSAVVAFDPDAARRQLDQLGWRLDGAVRRKDGKPLVVRNVVTATSSGDRIARILQDNLRAIGVDLRIEAKPAAGYFTDWITVGNFDIGTFGWGGDAFPLSGLTQIYASNGQSNFGKIGTPEIDAKIEQTLAEQDPGTARRLANEVDVLLWDEVFSLPLFQAAGNVGVRSALANYGAPGIADVNYTAIGFMP